MSQELWEGVISQNLGEPPDILSCGLSVMRRGSLAKSYVYYIEMSFLIGGSIILRFGSEYVIEKEAFVL